MPENFESHESSRWSERKESPAFRNRSHEGVSLLPGHPTENLDGEESGFLSRQNSIQESVFEDPVHNFSNSENHGVSHLPSHPTEISHPEAASPMLSHQNSLTANHGAGPLPRSHSFSAQKQGGTSNTSSEISKGGFYTPKASGHGPHPDHGKPGAKTGVAAPQTADTHNAKKELLNIQANLILHTLNLLEMYRIRIMANLEQRMAEITKHKIIFEKVPKECQKAEQKPTDENHNMCAMFYLITVALTDIKVDEHSISVAIVDKQNHKWLTNTVHKLNALHANEIKHKDKMGIKKDKNLTALVKGLKARRSMQTELTRGSNESVASDAVKVENKVLVSNASKSKVYQQEARQAAIVIKNASQSVNFSLYGEYSNTASIKNDKWANNSEQGCCQG
uniref:Uncharacterized protein n=1 Tax=Ditylenchus dipsaci TaxID=166011 RepID=A0A915ERM9_9BILA